MLKSLVLVCLVLLLPLIGCAGSSPSELERAAATPNIQSTVEAGIAATIASRPKPTIGARASLKAKFEESGYRFEDSSLLRDGRQRTLGNSDSDIIDLIGPADNLSTVSLTVIFPEQNKQARLLALLTMAGFVQTMFPDWEGALDWTVSSLASTDGDGERVTIQEGKTYTVIDSRDLLDWVILTVEVQ